MATNCPYENDGVPGAPPPPPEPTPPFSNSLPSTSQQPSPSSFLPPPYHYRSQPDEWWNIPVLDNQDAINGSLFGYINYFDASPPPPPPLGLGASPFAPFVQPAMPPPSQQQLRYPSQPDEELNNIPALGNNDAMNASLFGDYFDASPPPPLSLSATPVAPFVQPAMPPAPHYSQQPPAMVTMGETQYCYSGAAPEHALLPEAPPPPAAEPAKPAGPRRRGRPRGSTAKSKSKSKVANTAAAAGRRQQEAATASAIIVRQDTETVGAGSAEEEKEEEQEVVEYADTNIPGVRFVPTDVEIIWYLRRKYRGQKMPVDFIQEFDVFEDHPDKIQEKYGKGQEGVWYVFSSRNRRYKNGTRPGRSVGKVGFWKSTSIEKDVKDENNNNAKIGRTNELTFMLGHQPKGTSTPWRIKEYRMEEYQKYPNPSSMLLDPWVLCKLYRTKDKPADQHDVDQPDEGDEHVGDANGGGGQDTIDGIHPPNGPEQELGTEEHCYFSLDDFIHGDPKDQ
ncbi:hypothetical protein D1007_37106 [Hordeum vulgare]|uniref:NAC domain-containing protein n=1 Tax=Hordeum vulgare subsp. vulgare TaxID=112509 RepID=A0A8I6XYC8_HORVV|nr:protein transport protein SEC31-like [Hordeum vulgare subsp. vulgare]KAE8788831.1 hypothetical protein D1007_37106 [Hordeum vulgare]KAI4985920.1 hypothetical protein ZWY2020_018550 [Hordeum vulgare]